jgi:hypothetical protein
MNAHSLTLLRKMPPGSALFARGRIDGGNWEVAWLVREESARLAKLGARPEIEFRGGVLEEGHVALIPVLVRVGPVAAESIYETWVNQHAEGGGILETLADQAGLVIRLYGDGCRLVRTLVVSNQLQAFARHALDRIATFDAWSMEQFDRAREEVHGRYPQVWNLWQALTAMEDVP